MLAYISEFIICFIGALRDAFSKIKLSVFNTMHHNGINYTQKKEYVHIYVTQAPLIILPVSFCKIKSYLLIDEICPERHASVLKGVT